MTASLLRHGLAAVTVLAAVAGSSIPSHAQGAPETERILAALKALDSRLAAIESKIAGKTRQEASEAKAQVQALRQQVTARSAPSPQAYAADQALSPAPVVAPVPPRWGGFYAGGSAGATYMRGAYRTVTTVNGSGTTQQFAGGILSDAADETSSSRSEQRLRGDDYGASFTALGGYNLMVGDSYLVGVQAEVSRHLVSAQLEGTGRSQQEVISRRTIAPFDTTTTRFDQTYNPTAKLDNEWSASLLGRFGVLVTSELQVYGLLGWSMGGFTVGGAQTEVLNGFTYGGGVERDFGWFRLFTQFKGVHYSESRDVVSNDGERSSDRTGGFAGTSFLSERGSTTRRLEADTYSLTAGVTVPFGF